MPLDQYDVVTEPAEQSGGHQPDRAGAEYDDVMHFGHGTLLYWAV
ncbi:hypothetical protein [Kutzneria chonburiensis]|uniref:Lasso RiPP family leader peptide-containing protein n=1 Tax=Kutzneria chonburiensis TaxID=1483604 RepID=A0ABV6MM42_9PSEU|nr:hypothetical protein [Kutzneria chonburiensis]